MGFEELLRELCRTGCRVGVQEEFSVGSLTRFRLLICSKVGVGTTVVESRLASFFCSEGPVQYSDGKLAETSSPTSYCPTSLHACSGSEHFASNCVAFAEDTLPGWDAFSRVNRVGRWKKNSSLRNMTKSIWGCHSAFIWEFLTCSKHGLICWSGPCWGEAQLIQVASAWEHLQEQLSQISYRVEIWCPLISLLMFPSPQICYVPLWNSLFCNTVWPFTGGRFWIWQQHPARVWISKFYAHVCSSEFVLLLVSYIRFSSERTGVLPWRSDSEPTQRELQTVTARCVPLKWSADWLWFTKETCK